MPPDRRPDRQANLRRRIADQGLSGLLISHTPNVRYLTGFTGSAALLVVSTDRTILLTDPRYATQAPAETRGVAEVDIVTSTIWTRLQEVLRGLRLPLLGFERDHMTVEQAERLTSAASGRLEPVRGLVEALRVAKDPEEVAAIRAAVALALEALDEALGIVAVGVSELEIASRLEFALRRRGSEWHPFQTIVASGPRSALPHARTSRRVLERGDFLLVDFGAQVDGYCSDLTRTVVVGAPATADQRARYHAVRHAQQTAIAGLRPGMAGREADALARTVLADAGLGEAFQHSLGHGVGLEVHEDPRLASTAESPLPAGAVVTVEPGVYLEGWGGVRLEDDVLLTSAGPEPLSPGAPELMEVS